MAVLLELYLVRHGESMSNAGQDGDKIRLNPILRVKST